MSHFRVPEKSRSNARKMRKDLTQAELKLWNELRAHRLMGLGFRRQMPIAGYIVDFACPSAKIIVEVDGVQHAEAEPAAADRKRTAAFEARGWTVIRFWNADIERDIGGVCQHIVTAAGLVAQDAARYARPDSRQEEHRP